MKRYLYFCPKCNSFYSKETTEPNESTICDDCNTYMKYTGITKIEWDNKTKEEKDLVKSEFISKNNNIESVNDNAVLFELKKISSDVHSLYNITLGLIVIALILGIVMATRIF